LSRLHHVAGLLQDDLGCGDARSRRGANDANCGLCGDQGGGGEADVWSFEGDHEKLGLVVGRVEQSSVVALEIH